METECEIKPDDVETSTWPYDHTLRASPLQNKFLHSPIMINSIITSFTPRPISSPIPSSAQVRR